MPSSIEIVENCLDSFVQYFATSRTVEGEEYDAIAPSDPLFPRTVQRTHLQRAAAQFGHSYTLAAVSNALQSYRTSQARDGGQPQRYAISARGYARGSWWHILDGPGFNRQVSEEMLLAHTKWVPEDAATRATADVVCELIPAMERSDTSVNRIVGTCQLGISTMLTLMVEQIKTQVDVGAASLNIPVAASAVVLTPTEEVLLDSLMAP